jgi:hypothetical protein
MASAANHAIAQPLALSPGYFYRAEIDALLDREFPEPEPIPPPRQQASRSVPRVPSPAEQAERDLDDALARVSPAHAEAIKAREQLRVDLAAIELSKTRDMLTPKGREKARDKALAKAQAALDTYEQAQALVDTALENRAALTGADRLFREATFVEADPDETRAERFQRRQLEEQIRTRLWNELMTAPPEEFAATIQRAVGAGNRALVRLASQVYERRIMVGGEQGFSAAGTALSEAQKMALSKDVQRLVERFSKLAIIKDDFDAVIPELRTGRRGDDLTEKVRHAMEKNAELGGRPEEGPLAFVEEQQAAEAARLERATHRADEVIIEAVLGDESDAASAFRIPISDKS